MIRGTTPELCFQLPFAAEELSGWRISFAQRGIEKFSVDETVGETDGTALRVRLEQAQSLSLEAGVDVDIQLRGRRAADGEVVASRILTLPVAESLNEEVLV